MDWTTFAHPVAWKTTRNHKKWLMDFQIHKISSRQPHYFLVLPLGRSERKGAAACEVSCISLCVWLMF